MMCRFRSKSGQRSASPGPSAARLRGAGSRVNPEIQAAGQQSCARLRDAAQKEGLNCIQTLIDFPPITRIAACNSLLDRGYGRPIQGVAISDVSPNKQLTQVTPSMSLEEAARCYALSLTGNAPIDGDGGGEIIDVESNPPDSSEGEG